MDGFPLPPLLRTLALHAGPVTTTLSLPSYTDIHLAGLDPAGLLALMRTDCDRVPRAVVDACARRGNAMVAALQDSLDRPWEEDVGEGDWCLRLHAVMILGLIGTEEAGHLLGRLMRRMAESGDFDLQDWFSGYWPALFANKPASVLPVVRDLFADRKLDWYVRANAVEPIVAAACRIGADALDDELARVAGIAADESEDWELRLSCGNLLIDFPRDGHRALVDSLAKRNVGFGKSFDVEDIERAFAAGKDEPCWLRFDNPWKFYSPQAIAERQERWAQEDARRTDEEFLDDDLADGGVSETYVREWPKIGRNDPCPCGSGRKYKRCCMLA